MNALTDKAVAQEGVLEADPGALRFGEIEHTETVTDIVTIHSVGDAQVTLLGAAIVGASAFSMTWTHTNVVLQPGDSADVAITYVPTSLDDEAELIVTSTAADDELYVPLSGALSAPAISVTPSPMLFESDNGAPVLGELLIENVGTAPLDLELEYIRDSGHFTIIDTPVPSTLDVGESAIMTIEYVPDGDALDDNGELWLESNAPSSPTLVPLMGTLPPPCLGLSEAWDRGMLDLYSRTGSVITLENLTTEDDGFDICVDRWYVYMGIETQDAIGGDPLYDPGAEYPLGTLTILPGETLDLNYERSSTPAWWCVEETQVTDTTYNFSFIGARAPTPLLDRALQGSQEDIWAYQSSNPAVVVGRTRHYIELIRSSEADRSDQAELKVINMGQADTFAEVTEVVPAGFRASGFSQDPIAESGNADGSTSYTFAVALDARIPTETTVHTIYDEVDISYTLTLEDTEACIGRNYTNVPTAEWSDSSGTPRVSAGSPMTIYCQ